MVTLSRYTCLFPPSLFMASASSTVIFCSVIDARSATPKRGPCELSVKVIDARDTPSAERSNVAGLPPLEGSSMVIRPPRSSATIDAILVFGPKVAPIRAIAPARVAGSVQTTLERRLSGNMTR